MKTGSYVALIVLAVLLPLQVTNAGILTNVTAEAGTLTINEATIVGGGKLSDTSTFAVGGVIVTVDIGITPGGRRSGGVPSRVEIEKWRILPVAHTIA